MSSTSSSSGFGERKRRFESDDNDPVIITSERSSKRRSSKKLTEAEPSELHRLLANPRLEMPVEDDFVAGMLDPYRYIWASKVDIMAVETSQREKSPKTPRKAPPPSIPDPSDPEWNVEAKTGFGSRFRPQKRAPKSNYFVSRMDEDDIQLENDDYVTQVSKQQGNRTLPFPLEVRDMIYRVLLRSNKPIAVYDGWKRVYKHGNTRQTGPAFTDRPSLDINILRVNRWTYPEGARILYSENTFLYRLRDPPAISSPPMNLDALIGYDSPPSTNRSLEGDDPNDEDYQDDNRGTNTRRRTRSTRKNKASSGACINVGKFLHLYRHIIIEAEHNRSGDDTLKSMADAIQIFNDPPPIDNDAIPLYPSNVASKSSKQKRGNGRKANKKARVARQSTAGSLREEGPANPTIIKSNIITLVIKIRPSHMSPAVPKRFTFVNFFDKSSPIPKAIQDLRPQQLHVKVMMGQLTNQRNGVNLPISFRHQRIICSVASGEPDIWAKDKEMIVRRKRKANESLKKLGDLSKNVHKFCNKYLVEDLEANDEDDMFDLDWDEIDDDESDLSPWFAAEAEAEVESSAAEAQEWVDPVLQGEAIVVSQAEVTQETEIGNEVIMEPQDVAQETQPEIQVEATAEPQIRMDSEVAQDDTQNETMPESQTDAGDEGYEQTETTVMM